MKLQLQSFLFATLLCVTTACNRPDEAAPGKGTGTPTPTGSGTPGPTPQPTDDPTPATLDISLHVEDATGADRSEPVRNGVPFPRSAGLMSTAGLRIMSPDGGSVPAQFRVLSRWDGAPNDATKPIKWLLVDFDAIVPANADRVYRLQKAGSQQTQGSLVQEDSAQRIVVDTGVATFTFSKTRFNLFDRVVLGDQTEVVSPDATAGAYLTKPDGTKLLAGLQTTQVIVEEDGPLGTVILARGKHSDGTSALLHWTMRVQLHKGRSEALVSYTFTDKDITSIRDYVAVDEMGISVPIATASKISMGSDASAITGVLRGETTLRQAGNLSPTIAATFNPGNADTLSWSAAGSVTGSGGKAPGWVDVSGAGGGVTAAMRWFWQQYPKKITATQSRLTMEIWPSEEADMRVYAAAQKTHEILFVFHDSAVDGSALGAGAARRMASPLFARCNPAWYARSGVFNLVGTADPADYPAEHRAVVEGFNANLEKEYQRTFVQRRFDSAGNGHSYSMWDFGDLRESSWGNMAYDTPRSLFIQWAMSGKRKFLDRALETSLHLRDVDVEHSPLDTRVGLKNNRGVAQPWLGRTKYNPSHGAQSHDLGYEGSTYGFEHHKGQGIGDHYFLTGDAMSKEVLGETYHYYNQWYVDAANGYHRTDGTRVVSHMLLVVLAQWAATGDPVAKQRADYIVNFLEDWQRRTSGNDPDGIMWNTAGDSTATFMNGVTAEALMLYELEFPAGVPVRDAIVDAAAWTIDPSNGQLEYGPGGAYFNAWTGDNYGITHATVLDPMVAGWLGYASAKTGDPAYQDVAKEVLQNSFDQDTSTPYIKAFTQETRLVPSLFWFLMTPEAQGVTP